MLRQVRSRKAAALWLALAALGLAAFYWYRLRPITAPADMARYLPPSDSPLVYLDVATLRRAGVLDALAGTKTVSDPDYTKFVSESKFDYRKDLDAVLASFQDSTAYYVVAGVFDWNALSRYAQSQGGACLNDLCRLPGSPGRQISFYLLRPRLLALAVSPDGWAASLITPHPKTGAREFPSEPVWLSLPGKAIRKDSLPAGTRAFASALESADALSIALGRGEGGYQALLRVTCRTSGDAARLAEQLTGATETLRTLISREKQQPNPNDLSGVLTSGRFRHEDRRVLGTWPMPDALIKSLTEGAL